MKFDKIQKINRAFEIEERKISILSILCVHSKSHKLNHKQITTKILIARFLVQNSTGVDGHINTMNESLCYRFNIHSSIYTLR